MLENVKHVQRNEESTLKFNIYNNSNNNYACRKYLKMKS